MQHSQRSEVSTQTEAQIQRHVLASHQWPQNALICRHWNVMQTFQKMRRPAFPIPSQHMNFEPPSSLQSCVPLQKPSRIYFRGVCQVMLPLCNLFGSQVSRPRILASFLCRGLGSATGIRAIRHQYSTIDLVRRTLLLIKDVNAGVQNTCYRVHLSHALRRPCTIDTANNVIDHTGPGTAATC